MYRNKSEHEKKSGNSKSFSNELAKSSIPLSIFK